jgi:hypothetical protein
MSALSPIARLAERYERAADEFTDLSAAVWKDAPPSDDDPFFPPCPPIYLASRVVLTLAHLTTHGLGQGGWAWAVFAREADAERSASRFDMLAREFQNLAGMPARDDRPINRCGYLLTLVADHTPESDRIACLPDNPAIWQPTAPVYWSSDVLRKRGIDGPPDWWCVRFPHVFQRIAQYLRGTEATSPPAAPVQQALDSESKVRAAIALMVAGIPETRIAETINTPRTTFREWPDYVAAKERRDRDAAKQKNQRRGGRDQGNDFFADADDE